MSLYAEFLKDDHRASNKWPHYFPIYERHLSKFRNSYVTLFEIGVAGGGSLQLWKRWLGPNALIVGVDVSEACRQVEEEQIHVRINRDKTPQFLKDLVKEFGPPDIVLDDGSHLQSEVNWAFDALFDSVPKNGVYMVEDLHTAYWEAFEGGHEKPGTFIERAKTFIDDINWAYAPGSVGQDSERVNRGKRISGLSFYASVTVIDVGQERRRFPMAAGKAPMWDPNWVEPTLE